MAKQVYFVTALTAPELVEQKLMVAIPDASMRYKLGPDKWFVSFDGITHDLAEKLGIRSDPYVGTGLVIPVASYSGRAPTGVWDWLKLRMA
jgi:hypothetical protein